MTEDIKLAETRTVPLWHKAVLWVGMLLMACHASTHIVGAGDTWVALACGRHFSNHGVDTVEPFSFNSHKAGPTAESMRKYSEDIMRSTSGKKGLTVSIKRWWAKKAGNYENWSDWSKSFSQKIHPTGWVNQNWGTHLTYYTLVKTFGSEGEYNYNMLIVWKFAVSILSVICIYYLGRMLGANEYLSAISAGFAMYVARTFIDVRPAVLSNLLVPLFVLILVLTVYRNIRYIWLLVPLSVFWCNFHGGYIYIFIMMIGFIGMHLLLSIPNKRFVSLGLKGTLKVICAALTAFIAVVVFNPFHLTNITHTFIIMFSEHAASWKNVHEWHSAFDWNNRVGSSYPFLVMFIIMWVVLAFWLIARLFKPRIAGKMSRQIKPSAAGDFQWPKTDLATLSVVAVTVQMAVGSRRFIPIAAALVCPMMAVFLDQSFKMITASRRFRKDLQLKPSVPSAGFVRVCVPSFMLLIVTLGAIWGAQFKRTYLDPFDADNKRTSIFMRMTGSFMKPFEVCEFINDNGLSGHLFNYWTEGGAVAFGQNPNPETGHIPLKLFMDGRAQAAYDHATYITWTQIKGGGPTVRRAALSGRELTNTDYKEIGKWITEQLKPYDVWVVLMPDTQVCDTRYNTFVRGLESTGHWHTVYVDDSQYLYVDTNTDKGRALIDKVIREQAVFPDEFSRYLSTGRTWLYLNDREMSLRGFEYLKKAFEIDPCDSAMRMLISSLSLEHVKPRAYPYIENYLKEFIANKDSYSKEAGYFKQLMAGRMAARYLSSWYKRTDPAKARLYSSLVNDYIAEHKITYEKTKW